MRRLARAAVFVAVYAACLAPWVIRNGIRADYWGFSSSYGDTLFEFALPQIISDVGDDRVVLPESRTLYSSLGRFGLREGNTPGESARNRRDYVLETIAAHPWTYAKLHAKGSLAFWLPATDALEIAGLTEGGKGTLAVLREQGLWPAVRNYFGDDWKAYALAVPILLFTLIQYLAAARCAALGIRRTRLRLPAEIWLLILIVLVSAAMPGVVAHPRFRVPIEPILNVAAAAGLASLFRRRSASAHP